MESLPRKQFDKTNAQSFGNSGDDEEAWIAAPPFYTPQIRGVDLRVEGELLLREPLRSSQRADVGS